MLALRDEAWAAVVRPEVTGKVVIGVPDDYASSLLPSVLKKFSATYPKVEIQVMGLPSSALAPLIRTAPSISCAAPASRGCPATSSATSRWRGPR